MNPEIEELQEQIREATRKICEIRKNCPHENIYVEQTEDYYSNGLFRPGDYVYGIDVWCKDCGHEMWFDEREPEYKHFMDKLKPN